MRKHGIQMSLSLSILALLLLVVAPPGAQAGHVNFFLGSKALDDNDWSPWDTHTEAGVEASWGGENWPVLIATDLFGSTKSKDVLGVDTQATTGELAEDLEYRRRQAGSSLHRRGHLVHQCGA